jgi:hypothetical protein
MQNTYHTQQLQNSVAPSPDPMGPPSTSEVHRENLETLAILGVDAQPLPPRGPATPTPVSKVFPIFFAR